MRHRSARRRSLVLLIPLTLLAAAPQAAGAQAAPPTLSAAGREALRPYMPMIGCWEGPARVTAAGGRVIALTQSEDVRAGAGGAALVIQGRGTMATPQGDREAFAALGVIWWDPAATEVRMRAWLADGRFVDVAPKVDGSTIVWGYTEPGGAEIRYTIRGLTEGAWSEVGERRETSGEWTRFYEMTLARKP